jgi:intraflagellar transport protein 140
MKTIINFY